MFVTKIVCVLSLIYGVKGRCTIPSLKLQALKEGGFRVYIPDEPGMERFSISANINDINIAIQHLVINGERRAPTNGFWILEFNNKLKQGDVVTYWAYIIKKNETCESRYEQTIKITRLLDGYTNYRCDPASTVTNGGKSTCLNNVIFQDKFEGNAINTKLWKVEHKIPTYSEPNVPFNSYQNTEDTRFIKDNKLYLKPNAVAEADVRGTLNLTDGCTGTEHIECFYEHRSMFLLPPVKSAKIVSTTSFKYGKIEIRAQLPRGDWIYPIVQLEAAQKDIANPLKILIAYSRGNEKLVMSEPNNIAVRILNGTDIGGRLLLSGPMVEEQEPERSKRLVHKNANQPFFDGYHTYGLLWTKDQMRFYVDSEEYGSVDLSTLTENFNRECVLSLGVGVGGLYDFPEGVFSGSSQKPWNNEDRNAILRFFEKKNKWLQTWDEERSCLIVDYVRVTAI